MRWHSNIAGVSFLLFSIIIFITFFINSVFVAQLRSIPSRLISAVQYGGKRDVKPRMFVICRFRKEGISRSSDTSAARPASAGFCQGDTSVSGASKCRRKLAPRFFSASSFSRSFDQVPMKAAARCTPGTFNRRMDPLPIRNYSSR